MCRAAVAVPVQSQFAYLRRVLKYCGLKALATRPGFGMLLLALKLTRRDHDRFLNASIRGFPADRLFELIRQQPCARSSSCCTAG